MVPLGCLMYTLPIDKYSKLLILKFGIQTGLGLDNLCKPLLMARQTAQKWFFGKGDTSLEIEILLVEREILLQRSRYFLWKVRYFFRNRDTSMEKEDTSLEIEMLLVGILYLVVGYFTFVAGSFCRVVVLLQFALLQPLSHNTKRKRG